MSVKRFSRSIGRVFDDYVEDIAVGTPWWVLLAVFGIGTPVTVGIAARLLNWPHPATTDGASLLGGCLVGGALALIARERQRFRDAITNKSRDVAALRRLTWQEFEIRLADLIRGQGYTVKDRGGFERDGGVDAIAEGRGTRIAIQAKQWREWTVNELHVRAFDSVVRVHGFSEGWLITCGRFTQPAHDWASKCRLRLIDGEELAKLLATESSQRESVTRR